MLFSEEVRSIVDKLHSGEISNAKLNEMRSNSRRYNKLENSIVLAVAYEHYRYEVKNGKQERDLRCGDK